MGRERSRVLAQLKQPASRVVWLKLLGVTFVGACVVAFLALVALAGEGNSSPGLTMQVLTITVFVSVLVCAYVLLRCSGRARGRALFFAVLAMLAVYVVPVGILVAIIATSNGGL